MKLTKYQLRAGDRLLSYVFTSEGKRGLIQKQIQFTLIDPRGIYNIAFGDVDPNNGDVNDAVVSDNGDSEKVLATVVSAVFTFLEERPHAWIFATGSSPSRTRLYQIGVDKYYDEIEPFLTSYGQSSKQWVHFEKGVTYNAFLAKLKNP